MTTGKHNADDAPAADGSPASDRLLGRRVRDFRILECIGRGGMGAVYRAEHLLLGELRALKVIQAEAFRSVPRVAERFQREARIAVRLRHPNLVLIHDFFIEEGDHFLVMEHVVGESLAHRLRERGALPVEEACRIAWQCCQGLAHAHDLGVIHRDLSPENVMLAPTPSGPEVKIIDFGIARAALATDEEAAAAPDTATLTRVGEFLGKPAYASPEQAGRLRRGERLDPRSDLYSLGLILYEMLTGVLPFHSDTALGYLSLHALQRPPAPSARRPGLAIPPALERVVLCCLEKSRERRFRDARTLAAAIEWAWRSGDLAQAPEAVRRALAAESATLYLEDAGVVEAGPIEHPEPVPPTPSLDGPPSGRRAAALLATGLLLLGAGGAAFQLWRTRAESPAPAAVAPPIPDRIAPPTPLPESVAPAPPAEAPAPAAAPAPPAPIPAAPQAGGSARPATLRQERPRPAPAAPAAAPASRAESFTSDAEMQDAYDQALAFERSHEPQAAIARWKAFRARGPSKALDEAAKRRITDLSLAQLQRLE